MTAASMALLGLILHRLRSARSRRSEGKPGAGAPGATQGSADLDERLATELDALDTERDV